MKWNHLRDEKTVNKKSLKENKAKFKGIFFVHCEKNESEMLEFMFQTKLQTSNVYCF